MAFKPAVKKCDIEDEGEAVVFFVRQPSGREMLQMVKDFKKDASPLDSAREVFGKFVVQEDGEKLSAAEVDEMLDWRFGAMNKARQKVQDEIGLTAAVSEKKA